MNATEQPITILLPGDATITLQPSGLVLHCAARMEPTQVGLNLMIDGQSVPIPTKVVRYGRLTATQDGVPCDIPRPRRGVYYIVNPTVRLAVGEDRFDFLSTGMLVNTPQGQLACDSLSL